MQRLNLIYLSSPLSPGRTISLAVSTVQLVKHNLQPGPPLLVLCWGSDCAGCGAVLNPCSEVQSGSLFLNARVFHVPQGTCVPSFPEAYPAFSVVRGKIFSRRITSSSETLPRSEGRMGSSPHSDSPRHVLFNRDLKRGGGISRQKY